MSRYGDRFKDDLYDDLKYKYQESGMTPLDFIALVLSMLSELAHDFEWARLNGED